MFGKNTVWKNAVWKYTVWENTIWKNTVWKNAVWENTVWFFVCLKNTLWKTTILKGKNWIFYQFVWPPPLSPRWGYPNVFEPPHPDQFFRLITLVQRRDRVKIWGCDMMNHHHWWWRLEVYLITDDGGYLMTNPLPRVGSRDAYAWQWPFQAPVLR